MLEIERIDFWGNIKINSPEVKNELDINGRFTTIVHLSETTNCITGVKTNKKTTYGVYDKKTGTDVIIPEFHPTTYEEIKNKAIEMNNRIVN